MRRRLDRSMKARVLRLAAVRPSVVMDPPTPFKRLGPISRLKDFITPTEDVSRARPSRRRPRRPRAVAGYFGTNSVKWLARITLAGTRPEGRFTTRLYNRRVEHTGREHVEPAQELDVNAVIVRPADQDRVPPGRHLVTGWAWSASGITRVEVSTDGGASWPESHVVARGPRRRGSASDSNGMPRRRAPTRFGLAPPTAGAGCNRTEGVTPSTRSGSRSCNDTRSRGPVRVARE